MTFSASAYDPEKALGYAVQHLLDFEWENGRMFSWTDMLAEKVVWFGDPCHCKHNEKIVISHYRVDFTGDLADELTELLGLSKWTILNTTPSVTNQKQIGPETENQQTQTLPLEH